MRSANIRFSFFDPIPSGPIVLDPIPSDPIPFDPIPFDPIRSDLFFFFFVLVAGVLRLVVYAVPDRLLYGVFPINAGSDFTNKLEG